MSTLQINMDLAYKIYNERFKDNKKPPLPFYGGFFYS